MDPTAPDVANGFGEAWDGFCSKLGADTQHSSYERKLAEAFYCIGKTAGLVEACEAAGIDLPASAA